MLKLIKSIPLFFTCFLIYLLSAGILLFIIEQGDLIRFFSDHRSIATDTLFKFGTRLGEEFVYVFFGVILIFVRYRYALLVGLTGFLTMGIAFVLKWIFAHDRPFAFFSKLGEIDSINLIEGVHMMKGTTSFPSGHTMSAFALYGLIALLFPKKRLLEIILFLIALLVGFSRIYLVQHFLQDVYLGSILGVFLALSVFWIQSRFPINTNNWIDRSILFKKNIS